MDVIVPARGEQQGSAKATESVVQQIRRRYTRYCRLNGTTALAKEFGLCPVQVYRIAKGKAWRHV